MSEGFSPACSATVITRRYSTEPRITASVAITTVRVPKMPWPRITEARPTTIMPMPMPMSAKPWYCAIRAPDKPTRALDRHRPRIFCRSVFTPKERIISGLSPVACMARPASVYRNQSSASFTSSTPANNNNTPTTVPCSPASRRGVKTVSSRNSARFALPPISRRFTEYRAVMVRMPASNPLIRALVCSNAVIRPAKAPTTKPTTVANHGLPPCRITMAAVAAPLVKDWSTVRSGKSNTRNVRYTPRAMIA